MSEFHPTTLYFIMFESLGGWLWLLIALAVALFWGIVNGARKLHEAGRPATRPLMMATVMGLIALAISAFLVPGWTLADRGALAAPIDHLFVLLLALIPGAFVSATVFSLASLHCAARQHHA